MAEGGQMAYPVPNSRFQMMLVPGFVSSPISVGDALIEIDSTAAPFAPNPAPEGPSAQAIMASCAFLQGYSPVDSAHLAQVLTQISACLLTMRNPGMFPDTATWLAIGAGELDHSGL